MIKLLLSLLLFSVIVFVSCSGQSTSKQKNALQNESSRSLGYTASDTNYVYTGFYFLTDKPEKGVRMKKEGSDEFFLLEKRPFASVVNIKQTEIKTSKLEQGEYTELCLVFDSKGTKDLEQGTGDNIHQKLALVLAGRLLYVVDNIDKISTGVMFIGLPDRYSAEEKLAIKKAVDQKL